MDMHVGLGYRLFDWLSIGGGIHSFLNLEGETFIDTVLLDVTDLQNSTYVLPGVNRQVIWSFAPLGSVLVKPVKGLRVGVAYRGANKAKVKYQQIVNIGIPWFDKTNPTQERVLNLISASLPFDYTFFFTPQSVTGGASSQLTERVLVSVDLAWYQYSEFIDGKGNVPNPGFEDTWIPRAGVDFELLQDLHLYGGYFYEPSPVPDQTTQNNYMDMDRHVFSFGAGYTIPGIGHYWKKPLTFQALIQGQYLPDRQAQKTDTTLYGPSYDYNGYIIQAGVAIVFHY
jgi:long-chain fatty acid transport protein